MKATNELSFPLLVLVVLFGCAPATDAQAI